MQHKCVKCGKIYEKTSEELLIGCICGGKMFYFVKEKKGKKEENVDYYYELDNDSQVTIFDEETLASINVVQNGKYEIDIGSLMDKESHHDLVYRYGDGKYSVDISSVSKKKKR